MQKNLTKNILENNSKYWKAEKTNRKFDYKLDNIFKLEIPSHRETSAMGM